MVNLGQQACRRNPKSEDPMQICESNGQLTTASTRASKKHLHTTARFREDVPTAANLPKRPRSKQPTFHPPIRSNLTWQAFASLVKSFSPITQAPSVVPSWTRSAFRSQSTAVTSARGCTASKEHLVHLVLGRTLDRRLARVLEEIACAAFQRSEAVFDPAHHGATCLEQVDILVPRLPR